MTAKKKKAKKSIGLVKVTVGQFGTPECKCVLVEKGSTIGTAFSKGGYSIYADEEIITLEGKSVKKTDIVKKDATYLLHGKFKSGQK